jgi:hypothetical protein
VDLDASTANNNSIVILLNNHDVYGSIIANNHLGAGGLGGNPLSDANNPQLSEETVIPTFNKDPPITLEEALFLVSGQPDKYTIKNMYLIINILAMMGFLVPLSMLFLFQEPKLECLNTEFSLYFRCSTQQACSRDYINKYRVMNGSSTTNSFI